MLTSIVSRDDSVYKAVPDLAMCEDGSLVCTYRESLFHLFHPFSKIAVQISLDGGLKWGPKQIVDECADYERDGGLNNPRILHLGEGRLILICDWIPPLEPEYSPNTEIPHLAVRRRRGNLEFQGKDGHQRPYLSVRVQNEVGNRHYRG